MSWLVWYLAKADPQHTAINLFNGWFNPHVCKNLYSSNHPNLSIRNSQVLMIWNYFS